MESGLNRGRNAEAIWQDLITDHGFAHGYERQALCTQASWQFLAVSPRCHIYRTRRRSPD